MVNKKIYISLVFFMSLLSSYSQVKIGYSDRCSIKNSIIMADVFLSCIDNNSLKDITCKGLVLCRLDSLGTFVSIERVKNINISLKESRCIEKYIKDHDIRFYYCWTSENEGIDESKLLKGISTNPSIIIYFNLLLQIVNSEYKQAAEKNVNISRYEILLEIIKKYKEEGLIPKYDYKSISS